MANDRNFDLGGHGEVPDYQWHQPEEPEPDHAAYAGPPDSLSGISDEDNGTALVEDNDASDAAASARDQRLPVSQLPKDSTLTAQGTAEDIGAGQESADKADDRDTDNDREPKAGTVIEVVFEEPDPPTKERVALVGALDRVYRVAEGPHIPTSVRSNLVQPADAVTVAAVTHLAVEKLEEKERADAARAAAPADGSDSGNLAERGRQDPEHLRAAMHESGPGKYMDALSKVDTRRDVWEPLTKPRGFAKALEEADPDGFLRTVRDRDEAKFWLGDPADPTAAPGDKTQGTGYVGLLLDPAIVGADAREGKRIMRDEMHGLKTLWGLHGTGSKPAVKLEDNITAVKSYIDKLNDIETQWINHNGHGAPGHPTQTVSPHHADRLEWFLTFSRPLMLRQGESAADTYTALIAREMADARIGARRQESYREAPDGYAQGQRVDRLSEADLADLALATRLEERSARHEDQSEATAAQVVMTRWEEVIARQDKLYQQELQRQHPEYFKPGVPPPVSPQHHFERFQQMGYRFRMRLGDHLPGPDPNMKGRAAANAGLLEDLSSLMKERARTREELRLATTQDPAGYFAGERPDSLSAEEIRDWAILTAVTLDVAMQPESGTTERTSSSEVLAESVADITQRELLLRHNARHRADPSRLYGGQIPHHTAEDVRAMVEVAALSARAEVQNSGIQGARELIAETATQMHRLLQGQHLFAQHEGDLSRTLGGHATHEDLDAMPEDTLGILLDATAAKVNEARLSGLPPDPDNLRLLQRLQAKVHAISYDRSGRVAAARESAALASAQAEFDAYNDPTNAVHITAGPGPEKPDLLVSLLASFGAFDRISVGGTRGVHDALRIAAGEEMSPSPVRDLVTVGTDYQSAETHIIQGRASAGIDPYNVLNDPAVKTIIIQDTPNQDSPGRLGLISSILQLIDPDDPRAPFHGQFKLEAARTGWADPTTLDVNMEDESLYTVVLRRVQAA